MLVLHNVRMKPSNVRKNGTTKVIKVLLNVMLGLHNVRMELSNVKKKKNKETTKCDKRNVTYDIKTV